MLSSVQKYLLSRPYLKRVLANISWMFADRVVRIGLGLIVSVWLARYLGSENFGLFSYAIALVAIGGAIATLGLDSVVVKELLMKPEDRDLILGTAVTLQFIGGMLTYLVIIGLIQYLKTDNHILILIIAILGPLNLFKASEVVKYWYESQLLSKVTIRAENAVFILFASIKGGLIFFEFDLVSIAIAVLLESVVVAVVLIVIYRYQGGVLSPSRFSKTRALKLLNDSWPLMVSSIAVMVYLRIDVVMLESYLGASTVGNYSVATRISEVWYFIPGVITASVFPSIVAAKKDSHALYSLHFVKLLSLLFWVSLGIAAITSLSSEWIVSTVFGQRYLPAASILSIIAWSTVFVFVGVASGRWFLVENLQRLLLYRTVIGAIINVALNVILIPRYGAIGAALATLASQAYANLFANLMSGTTRPLFRLQIKSVLYPFVGLRASKS
jgi:O-antigen/teichoic acid export membrane protein